MHEPANNLFCVYNLVTMRTLKSEICTFRNQEDEPYPFSDSCLGVFLLGQGWRGSFSSITSLRESPQVQETWPTNGRCIAKEIIPAFMVQCRGIHCFLSSVRSCFQRGERGSCNCNFAAASGAVKAWQSLYATPITRLSSGLTHGALRVFFEASRIQTNFLQEPVDDWVKIAAFIKFFC